MRKGRYVFGIFVIVIVIVGIFFMTTKSMQCTYPGCDKRRESGSEYCLEHKPDGEEEESKKEENKKEERETALEASSTESETDSVLCEAQQCMNAREEGSRYCDIHVCHKVGCNDGALPGGKFCYAHTCRQAGCFNVIISGLYCGEHYQRSSVRKTYSGSTGTKTYSSGTGWKSNFSGKSSSGKSSSGKRSSDTKQEDPYHARDYGDVEDFYYDYFDDFESFDDAETYFEDVQNE